MVDFTELIDLAAERLGAAVLLANDDFFAPKERLLLAAEPVYVPGKYTDRGKWMDGWETRRRREPGFDWCIVRLGVPGRIRGALVDTSHFKGNYPEHCSIEVASVEGYPDPAELGGGRVGWTEILPPSPLRGNAQNPFAIAEAPRCTHARLCIYPDGGVARLRLFGDVLPDWTRLGVAGGDLDLAAVEHGGLVVRCSDMFFGSRQNLIMPGRATDMRDGWETRRRRGPGHDWAIVRLGTAGVLRRAEVDTAWFKGNAPAACALEGCHAPEAAAEALEAHDWFTLLPRTPLQPHTRHLFDLTPERPEPATHVRLSIFPDGGVSRLRLHGRPHG
jgi:allantoicase